MKKRLLASVFGMAMITVMMTGCKAEEGFSKNSGPEKKRKRKSSIKLQS